MKYSRRLGQGHVRLQVSKMTIFKIYLLCHFSTNQKKFYHLRCHAANNRCFRWTGATRYISITLITSIDEELRVLRTVVSRLKCVQLLCLFFFVWLSNYIPAYSCFFHSCIFHLCGVLPLFTLLHFQPPLFPHCCRSVLRRSSDARPGVGAGEWRHGGRGSQQPPTTLPRHQPRRAHHRRRCRPVDRFDWKIFDSAHHF